MTSSATVQDAAAKKEAKRQRMRLLSVKELIETERAFVKDLEIIREVFLNPLNPSNSKSSIINAEQHEILFKDIPNLIILHHGLCVALEERFNNNWNANTSLIGDEMLQFAPYFKMYLQYLNGHENAAAFVCKAYRKNDKFRALLDNAQADPRCRGLDFRSFLVKPLQRITKYSLLLKVNIHYTHTHTQIQI